MQKAWYLELMLAMSLSIFMASNFGVGSWKTSEFSHERARLSVNVGEKSMSAARAWPRGVQLRSIPPFLLSRRPVSSPA